MELKDDRNIHDSSVDKHLGGAAETVSGVEALKVNAKPFGLRDKIGYMFGDLGNCFISTRVRTSSTLLVDSPLARAIHLRWFSAVLFGCVALASSSAPTLVRGFLSDR